MRKIIATNNVEINKKTRLMAFEAYAEPTWKTLDDIPAEYVTKLLRSKNEEEWADFDWCFNQMLDNISFALAVEVSSLNFHIINGVWQLYDLLQSYPIRTVYDIDGRLFLQGVASNNKHVIYEIVLPSEEMECMTRNKPAAEVISIVRKWLNDSRFFDTPDYYKRYISPYPSAWEKPTIAHFDRIQEKIKYTQWCAEMAY